MLTPQEALDQPQVNALGLLTEILYSASTTVRVPDLPLKLSALETGINAPPPTLGQHTAEILAELGFSDDEVRDLQEQRIV